MEKEIMDPRTECQIGDILYGVNNNTTLFGSKVHYMVFLEAGSVEGKFIGAMLTRTHEYDNIPLMPNHFFPGFYDNSHIVPNLLLKDIDWAPFVNKGKLSESGLGFITNCLKYTKPVLWEDYLKSSRKKRSRITRKTYVN